MKEVTLAANLLVLHEKNNEAIEAMRQGDMGKARTLCLEVGFGLLVASTVLLDKGGEFDVAL